MDVPRVLLAVAVACLGVTAPAVNAQPQDEDPEAVAAQMAQAKGAPKPWKHVRGFGRVLDLRIVPVVIDEPGLYAIDRNWVISAQSVPAIQITADDVTLDLHGFEIELERSSFSTLLAITGGRAEVRNGGLSACCDDGTGTLSTTGVATTLHHLSIFAYETMRLEGGGASLTDSYLSVRVEIRLGADANFERNRLTCNRGLYCVRVLGDGSRVTDNTFDLYQGGGIGIFGGRNLVVNNTLEAFEAPDAREAFVVEGDANVVRANTVLGGFTSRAVFVVNGTANTLDGNVVAPPTVGAREQVGMQFTVDGNYYGNNRMAAVLPFDLGATVQTDWGGNVGY